MSSAAPGTPAEPDAKRSRDRDAPWARTAEAGTSIAIRIMRGLYRLLGRRLSSALMWPIALYFTVVGREHRRAHRRYIEALRSTPRGRDVGPPHFGSALAHVHAFAINLFDRMVAWGGGLDDIRFIHQGSEHLFRLAEEKRGAILIGSHLGSFDMMRLLAGRHGLVVNVLMFTKNAERITAFLHNLDPESRVRVIALDPSSMRTAFEIKQCLDRGEFVGILGDRIWPADRAHRELLPFFGQPAPFSLRPFLLAGVLGAPLLFAVCVRRGPSTYEAAVEVLHPGGQVPRAAREARAREWLQGYVASLEHWCGEEPLQWFNFYDTWQVEDA